MRSSLRQVLFRSATGLDLNFAGGVFSLNNTRTASPAAIPGWSFSRTDTNGTATALDLAGNVIQFSTGVPRITNRGILVEEARTNLLLNSATLSTQSVTTTAVAHTLSFYGTGTVTLTGTSTAGPLVGTGASNRVTLTFTPTAGTLTLTVTGSVTTAQLEAGAFATSPIITTGAAGTRDMDFPVELLAADASAGFTLVTEGEYTLQQAANDTAVATVASADGAALVGAWRAPSGDAFFQVRTAGIGTAVSYGILARSGARIIRQATAVQAGNYRSAIDGTLGISATTGTPTGLTRVNIGFAFSNGRPMNGYIRRIRVLPYAATDAQLQALTAP